MFYRGIGDPKHFITQGAWGRGEQVEKLREQLSCFSVTSQRAEKDRSGFPHP